MPSNAKQSQCPESNFIKINLRALCNATYTIAHKKLKPITKEQVYNCFKRSDLRVFTSTNALISELKLKNWQNANLLLMSSGNFDGIDFNELANDLLK